MRNEAQQSMHDLQMSAITSALEAKPDAPIPADFTARVMARLPQPKRRLAMPLNVTSSSRYGASAAGISLFLLLAGMTILAPRTQGSTVWLTLQGLLFLQFCALLLWFGMSRRHSL